MGTGCSHSHANCLVSGGENEPGTNIVKTYDEGWVSRFTYYSHVTCKKCNEQGPAILYFGFTGPKYFVFVDPATCSHNVYRIDEKTKRFYNADAVLDKTKTVIPNYYVANATCAKCKTRFEVYGDYEKRSDETEPTITWKRKIPEVKEKKPDENYRYQ